MGKIIKWKCGICGSAHKSHSEERWKMDFCECGKSAVDLEEHYYRTLGKVEIIEETKTD